LYRQVEGTAPPAISSLRLATSPALWRAVCPLLTQSPFRLPHACGRGGAYMPTPRSPVHRTTTTTHTSPPLDLCPVDGGQINNVALPHYCPASSSLPSSAAPHPLHTTFTCLYTFTLPFHFPSCAASNCFLPSPHWPRAHRLAGRADLMKAFSCHGGLTQALPLLLFGIHARQHPHAHTTLFGLPHSWWEVCGASIFIREPTFYLHLGAGLCLGWEVATYTPLPSPLSNDLHTCVSFIPCLPTCCPASPRQAARPCSLCYCCMLCAPAALCRRRAASISILVAFYGLGRNNNGDNVLRISVGRLCQTH